MRPLVPLSMLLLAGCAGAPPASAPRSQAVALPPPARLERPWLLSAPADEITLLDTRAMRRLRMRNELPAVNASAT